MAAEEHVVSWLVVCGACGDRWAAGVERRHCRCGRSSGRLARGEILVLAGPSRTYRRVDAGEWAAVDGRSRNIARTSLVA